MLNWFLVGIVFLIIEGVSFGLVSIWFALGAFVTMFFNKLEMINQFYIFVTVSGLSLIFIRKLAMKFLKKNGKELDRISGKEVKIEKKSTRGNMKIYTVSLDGKYWDCISVDDLETGDVATVIKIEGNKLILEKN
ncbi:NfeD family protein [Fusobacterium sp.]|uniref:NfeD family protein n=1 Tax=Fusobacterium sp. TaxID=68766 RepID=UPI00260BE356|nr:NfeD family protein [Fusobacterium sp.]